MDLKARLQRADALRQSVPERSTPARHDHHPPLESLVAGRWEAQEGGRCFVAEERYALAFRHGDLALGEVFTVPERVWQSAATGADARPLDMRRAVFVDIETTGLARGSGTYAFLVGVGAFEGDEFVLRQFFMPDYADEDAMLALLAGALRDNGGLVTFNGRTFDWPIIQTRYILGRREPPCDGLPHLDLLHLARRLWRRSLASCALSSLEEHVLHIGRSSSDVPGYLIPALYQDYLERGVTGPLADVFYHNLIDILSLVTLAARAGSIVDRRSPPNAPNPATSVRWPGSWRRRAGRRKPCAPTGRLSPRRAPTPPRLPGACPCSSSAWTATRRRPPCGARNSPTAGCTRTWSWPSTSSIASRTMRRRRRSWRPPSPGWARRRAAWGGGRPDARCRIWSTAWLAWRDAWPPAAATQPRRTRERAAW